MVTVDPASGQRSGPEPLRTLASFRRHKGRIFFGALFNLLAGPEPGPQLLTLNDVVSAAPD